VDYLVKPVNLEELELVIQRALEGTRLRRTGDALKAARKGLTDNPMVGASPAMRQVESHRSGGRRRGHRAGAR
jgi:DNA-binding NtrC family response regulator